MATNETVTNEVIMHHLRAFGNNDLDEIMKDYTEQSQVLTPEGPLKGLEAVRKFFENFFIAIPAGAAFEMKQLTVTHNVAYIAWSSKSAVAEIPMGTDTFFLDGGKIRLHTVASYTLAK